MHLSMVFMSQGNKVEATGNGQKHSALKDSLEGKSKTPATVPDTNCDADCNGISQGVHLGIIPQSFLELLQDKSDWKKRLSGVGKMQAVVKEFSNSAITNKDLSELVKAAMIPVADPHFKVCQTGLELVYSVVLKVERRISSHLTTIVSHVVIRMGSTKVPIRQAGMRVIIQLMHCNRPEQVVMEAANCGLRYKSSRVREETINIIMAGLLQFSRSCFHFPTLLRDIAHCLLDTKPKVRQAILELLSLIAHLTEQDNLKYVVSNIASIERTQHAKLEERGEPLPSLTLLDAFYYRFSRHVNAKMTEEGLVEHAVDVTSSSAPPHDSGIDVMWILTHQGSPKGTTTALGELVNDPARKSSLNGSVFRPYVSATKRLPWNIESSDANPSRPVVLGPLNGGMHPHPPPLPPPSHASPKHPPPLPIKKTSGSYHEMYMAKVATHLPTTMGPPTSVSNSNGPAAIASRSRKGSLGVLETPRKPEPISLRPPSQRHNSVPSELGASLPLKAMADRPGLAKPAGVLCSSGIQQGQQSVTTTSKQQQQPPSMSVTWPRSLPLRASQQQQISADAASAVAGMRAGIRSSAARPLSKPRVRNPLTLLNQQHLQQVATAAATTSPTPAASSSSPTQLEQDFLTSRSTGPLPPPPPGDAGTPPQWGENSWDEEYFNIPEDTTVLNGSLSCSLTSLREMESAKASDTDKLKYIRKEAASRKALLLSAAASASNSPNVSRQPSGERRKMEQNSPQNNQSCEAAPPRKAKKKTSPKGAVTFAPYTAAATHKVAAIATTGKKWNSEIQTLPTQSVDLNKTYTLPPKEEKGGGGGAYSSVYAAKKQLSTPSRATKPGPSRRVERPTEETDFQPMVREISLEGHRMDRGGIEAGSSREPPQQPKKKPRKIEAPRGNMPPPRPRTRSNGFGSMDPSVERRPSIEKGGTNTIDMEVSGVGSPRNGTQAAPSVAPPPTLSQTTKESIIRRRKQQMEEEAATLSQSATYPSKPPHPPPAVQSDPPTASAPVETIRKRKRKSRKNELSATAAGHETPKYAHVNNTSEADNSGSGGSPNESQLEELHPFSHPEHGVRDASQSLSSEDWNIKCEGMLSVRRLAMYHPEVLGPHLHSLVRMVQQEVKNLRSVVARGAIACLGDLFALMKGAMEQDLDSITRVLLQKCGEANTFIREDVEKALTEMVYCVAPGKALLSIINGGTAHRSAAVRKITAQFILLGLQRFGPSRLLHSSKELEKALPAVVQLLRDHSPETRYYARKCLNELWQFPEFDRAASRVLTEQLLGRAKEAVETLKTKGVGEPPSDAPSSKQHHGSSSSSSRHPTGGPVRQSHGSSGHHSSHTDGERTGGGGGGGGGGSAHIQAPSSLKHSKKHSTASEGVGGRVDTAAAALPDGLLERLSASDWSERFEAISELERFISMHPTAMAPHLHKVFDVLYVRLSDRNSKVNLHALQAFSNIVPLLGNMLVPVASSLIGSLVPNLASRNATIHSTAMTVLNLLTECVDPIYLVQPVANNGQYGNARVQPIMIRKLAELTVLVYDQKPQLISRQVLPVLWHLLSSKTPATGEAKTAILALAGALYQCMGQGLLDSAGSLAPVQQRKLQDLLAAAAACR